MAKARGPRHHGRISRPPGHHMEAERRDQLQPRLLPAEPRGLLPHPKPDLRLGSKANAAGDVWHFGQEANNPHSALFPVELVQRCTESIPARVRRNPPIRLGLYGNRCRDTRLDRLRNRDGTLPSRARAHPHGASCTIGTPSSRAAGIFSDNLLGLTADSADIPDNVGRHWCSTHRVPRWPRCFAKSRMVPRPLCATSCTSTARSPRLLPHQQGTASACTMTPDS